MGKEPRGDGEAPQYPQWGSGGALGGTTAPGREMELQAFLGEEEGGEEAEGPEAEVFPGQKFRVGGRGW